MNKKYKTVRVFSRQNFNKYIKEQNLNDENIDDKNLVIIEFFNSQYLENAINNNRIEDEFNYCNGYDSRLFKSIHKNVFQVECDDILGHKNIKYNLDGTNYNCPLYLFKYSDAVNLYNFIIANKDKDKFIIHCSAGISRSGAVGLFIKEFFEELDFGIHIPEYNNIYENKVIYGLLKEHHKAVKLLDNDIELKKKYSIYPQYSNDKILLLPFDIENINTSESINLLKYNLGDDTYFNIINVKFINKLYYEEVLKKSDELKSIFNNEN